MNGVPLNSVIKLITSVTDTTLDIYIFTSSKNPMVKSL